MEHTAVPLDLPAECNLVAGQAHFIKTVEDLAEFVVTSVPAAGRGRPMAFHLRRAVP